MDNNQNVNLSRSRNLVSIVESITNLMSEHLEKFKDETSTEELIKGDLRTLIVQIENVVLSWLMQIEYNKFRAHEIKLAGEVYQAQMQAAQKQVVDNAVEVKKPWSIEDEE